MEWLNWVMEQAKAASPLVAVFCLGVAGLLWRQHVKDQRTILAMWRAQMAAAKAQTRAQVAQARTISVLTAKLEVAHKARR